MDHLEEDLRNPGMVEQERGVVNRVILMLVVEEMDLEVVVDRGQFLPQLLPRCPVPAVCVL